MATAVAERKAEQDEEKSSREMQDIQDSIAREVKEIMRQKEQERQKQQRLDEQLVETMDSIRFKKDDNIRNDRAQELVERDLNHRLLTIDNLEEEVLGENPEVGKRAVEYKGSEIPVYDLKGIKFSVLSHAIDYRSDNWDHHPERIGSQTSQNLLRDPSLWSETREQAEHDKGYGTQGGNARGNVISASYVNSESNLDSRVGTDNRQRIHVCYGFSHLDGNSLLSISYGDGGTPNKVDDHVRPPLPPPQPNDIDRLEGSDTKKAYNEFLLRRYSETGKPKLPDYIIAQDGVISEDMMLHAQYFNIPIVNIDSKAYQKKFEKRALDVLENVSEESDYSEICSAIDRIKTTARYNHEIGTFESIGDGASEEYFNKRRRFLGEQGQTEKELLNLEELEFKKRPQFIIDKIKEATESCRKATREGRRYVFSSDALDDFSVSMFDVNEDKMLYGDFISSVMCKNGPGACDYFEINMRMKDSTRNIETIVNDGEHRIEAERYKVITGKRTLDNQDSSIFEVMRPFVQEYFSALRENKNL